MDTELLADTLRQVKRFFDDTEWRSAASWMSSVDVFKGLSSMDEFIRFLIGGSVVSAFAALSGIFKPVSFAGLFGAAPSVALATLGLAISKEGKMYAGTECRSMIAGAVALGFYSILVNRLLAKFRISALTATLSATALWFFVAFGLKLAFIR